MRLLSSRNIFFTRLFAQIICLWAHFPDYPIKEIQLNNVEEFTSQAFSDYCISIGITIEHLDTHLHMKNGLPESLIKCFQLIAKPLLTHSKLPNQHNGT